MKNNNSTFSADRPTNSTGLKGERNRDAYSRRGTRLLGHLTSLKINKTNTDRTLA